VADGLRRLRAEVLAVMKRLKEIFDPDGVLNPGIVLNDDPNCHLHHLKHPPSAVPDVDACVEAASHDVVVPENLACCGTAGDRGLIFPELSASALRKEKADLEAADAGRFVSSNLTCETGLGAQTGRSFESFLYLLEEASRG